MSESSIHHKSADTWPDFIANIREMYPGFTSNPYVFRGQASREQPLQSTWERRLQKIKDQAPDRFNRAEHEAVLDRHMELFRKRAVGVPGVSTDHLHPDDPRWLCLARHHGLLSPLMDWTLSPYVAAFFAFTAALNEANPGLFAGSVATIEPPAGEVAVWALYRKKEDWNAEDDPLEFIDLRMDQFLRQRAQHGAFTRLHHPTCVELVDYFEHHSPAGELWCFTVPATEAGKALFDLQLMGVDFAGLFPDLDGAARQANLDVLFEELRKL